DHSTGIAIPDAIHGLRHGLITILVGVFEVLAGAEDHHVATPCRMTNQRRRTGDRLGLVGVVSRDGAEQGGSVVGYVEAVGSAVVDIETPQVALQVASIGEFGHAIVVVIRQLGRRQAIGPAVGASYFQALQQVTVNGVNHKQRSFAIGVVG